MEKPRQPVVVDEVLHDPGLVRTLVERNAPYWPVQRYFATADGDGGPERRAGRVAARAGRRTRAARRRPRLPRRLGVRPAAGRRRRAASSPTSAFADAARRVFDGALVRPQIVYANLIAADAVRRRRPHRHPRLPRRRSHDASRSGSSSPWAARGSSSAGACRSRPPSPGSTRARAAASPTGPTVPTRRPRRAPPRTNTAVVGDNDVMFHRVESIGGADDDMVRGLTLDSQLAWRGDGTWAVVDAERELGALRRSRRCASASRGRRRSSATPRRCASSTSTATT